MKKVDTILRARGSHWVGDGFPVRSLFSYGHEPEAISPFLLFDYAGPHQFEPSTTPRGVGEHPHRGFETVTIVYDGEVSHRDSTGSGGTIRAGDVQWMTAASGVVHDEFHSPGFSKTGGPFKMVQLWVNLPAKDKMSKPGYQAITHADIPVVELANGNARARIIAGEMDGVKGPATTYSPINLWDLSLEADAEIALQLPEGHNSMVAVLSGHVSVNGDTEAGEAEVVRFERGGTDVKIRANGKSTLLVMTGEPINEPVVGSGPFVMNSRDELHQAYADFRSGQFGQLAS